MLLFLICERSSLAVGSGNCTADVIEDDAFLPLIMV